MRTGQSLTELIGRLLGSLQGALAVERPGLVLAQGDTSSVLAVAMACVRGKIPFGHVEAGLRTGKLDAPFPEEANRVVTSHLVLQRHVGQLSKSQVIIFKELKSFL